MAWMKALAFWAMVAKKTVPPGLSSWAQACTMLAGSGTCSSSSMQVMVSKLAACVLASVSALVQRYCGGVVPCCWCCFWACCCATRMDSCAKSMPVTWAWACAKACERMPPPQPMSSTWLPASGVCDAIHCRRRGLMACRACRAPWGFHHWLASWAKRAISCGSALLCVALWGVLCAVCMGVYGWVAGSLMLCLRCAYVVLTLRWRAPSSSLRASAPMTMLPPMMTLLLGTSPAPHHVKRMPKMVSKSPSKASSGAGSARETMTIKAQGKASWNVPSTASQPMSAADACGGKTKGRQYRADKMAPMMMAGSMSRFSGAGAGAVAAGALAVAAGGAAWADATACARAAWARCFSRCISTHWKEAAKGTSSAVPSPSSSRGWATLNSAAYI